MSKRERNEVFNSNKKPKTSLPLGFFDNPSAQDEEWSKFQAEMGNSGEDNSTVPMKSSQPQEVKSKLEILGIINNDSTIQADAVIKGADLNANTNTDMKSNTDETKSKSIRSIDDDKFVEDEAAEKLFEQIEIQNDLYERIDKLKKLREQSKTEDTAMPEQHPETQPLSLGIEYNPSDESDDSDSENDIGEDDLWRKRRL